MEIRLDFEDGIEASDNLSSKISYSISHYFPLQLKLLDQTRSNAATGDEKLAANLLIIISATSFIESILFENFSKIIEKEKYEPKNLLVANMIKFFEERISTATFANYEKISKEMLGVNLNEFAEKESWEGIKSMFTLRNQIVHGKEFSIEYAEVGNDFIKEQYRGNYFSVIEFLSKRKLVKKGDLTLHDLLTIEVTDYFISITKSFFIAVTKNMSEKYKTSAVSSLEYTRSLLSV